MDTTVKLPMDILDFWFGELEGENAVSEKRQQWYQSSNAFDEAIKDKFLSTFQAALAGQLGDWRQEPKSLMALIILLDQMPRNMFRGDKRAFEADNLALELCLYGLEHGLDKKLCMIERVFFYHPLEHSEQLEMQELSVKQFQNLVNEYRATDYVESTSNALHWAKEHYDIVKAFGRFPHRNKVLDRASTLEEEKFLLDGPSFGQ